MWQQLWTISQHHEEVAKIFIFSFAILLAKVSVKYITKLPAICNVNPEGQAAKKAAHFECLRLGTDLAFIGMVASLGVMRVVITHARPDQLNAIGTFEASFIALQLVLLLVAAIFTAVFSSPTTTFRRGIWVPSLFGLISVYSAVASFRVLIA
jgi:hypothetical protein